MKIKPLIAAGLAFLLLAAPLASVSAAPVGEGAIGQAAYEQLIPGSLLGKAPGDKITRGEFADLVSLLNVKLGVPAWGWQGGTLQDPVTLQEAAVVLVQTIDAAFPKADVGLYTETTFDDNWQLSGEARPAVNYLYHYGIAGIPGSYRISPQHSLTVQQAVNMVRKIYTAGAKFDVSTYIPDQWEWHIEPIYDGLGPNTRFSGGLAAVSQNGRYGYIDRSGKVAVPFQYDMAYDFSEGLAKVEKSGKAGYINKQGTVVIPLAYDDGGSYSEGRVWLKLDGKYGFANEAGIIVVPIQYDYAYSFKEGLAPVREDGLYGYIDPLGNTVIPFQYPWASSFSEGLARTGSKGQYNYIDKTGQVALPLNLDYLFDFEDGRAIVFNRDQYGVIDKNGNYQIPFGKWGLIYGFHNGLSVAHGDSGYEGNHSFINTSGNVVIGSQPFYDAEGFSEGLGTVASHNKVTDKVTRSYITRTGELVLPKRANIKDESPYDGNSFYLQAFSEGLAAAVTKDGKLGFIENPLLKRPVEGTAVLKGDLQAEAGSDVELAYGLRMAKNVSAQKVVLAYDEALLELQGAPDVLSGHTVIAKTAGVSPGVVRYTLAVLGSTQLQSDVDVLKFHFKAKQAIPAGAYAASVSAMLADEKGNEWTADTVWNAIPAEGIVVTGAGGATAITAKGGSLQLNAAVLPANADNPAVTWAVYNEDGTATDKALISAEGLVTAKKDGAVKAVATAADGSGVSGSLIIAISGHSGSTPVSSGGGGSSSDTISHELGTVKLSDNSATLTIPAAKLEELAKKAGDTVILDLSSIAKKTRIVDIPAASFAALSKSGKSLEVNTGAASIILPANALKLDGVTGTVKISIGANGQATVSQPGLVPLTEAVSVAITDGSKNLNLQAPARIELDLKADGGQDLRKAGMYAWNAKSGVWEYLGGVVRENRLVVQTSAASDTVYAAFIYNKSFADVASGHWAKDYVEVMAARHVVDGIGESSFGPSGTVTRAEFAAMAVRMLQLPAAGSSASFPDVAKGAWYAGEIAAAVQAGILQGDGTGIRPNDSISRQEMAVIAVRILKSYGIHSTAAGTAYADQGQIADWAQDAVKATQSLGIMNGQQGNSFAPLNAASRAEAAAVFYRLMDKSGQM
ncbi:WG repeat-containing protein [Paenibacillus sp. YN15]|uniref:WG repeat-containing protein n=1 Tax=Paenibacillus sp. YN15 TaxID=1742774 RepID=UPI000DCC1DE4|nr:WG repeat-containing protein [Paenibacillus sp. YN15]RAU95722.1 hypothetical protein DQG13_21690 [Paenibacillus sp. YN15]